MRDASNAASNAASDAARDAAKRVRARTFISKGLATLWAERSGSAEIPPIDVLIIGSGYGGAVAAAALASSESHDKPKLNVYVLERGSEYLSGMFPSRVSDLAGHVRFSSPNMPAAAGVRTGLFDVRVGPDVNALVANGLGGGSLINAGVMLQPDGSVFQDARWPEKIRAEAADLNAWAKLYEDAQSLLGARTLPDKAAPYQKIKVMDKLARGLGCRDKTAKRVPITVATEAGLSTGNINLNACNGCGDCATGCNHEAKASLDVSLLVTAQHNGAKIYTGATVLKLKRYSSKTGEAGETGDSGWEVHVVHTDPQLRSRETEALILKPKLVILSAGSFGSTEILMRTQDSDSLQRTLFSSKLGSQFSTNGDMIEAGYNLNEPVNCVATECELPENRAVGPTITTMIDKRKGNPQTDVVVQEMSVPGTLRRIFEEGYTLSKVMNDFASPDKKTYGFMDAPLDICAVDRLAINNTLVVALIGRDAANGRLRLTPGPDHIAGDGAVSVDWPEARNEPRLVQHHNTFKAMLAKAKLGGATLSNPMWSLLPADLAPLLGGQLGPLITVHPLGGCPMGEDVTCGVVNHLGQVFNASDTSRAVADVYDDLMVLDGAIVPTSLGINPALTITVLAHRAIQALPIYKERQDVKPKAPERRSRPYFRNIKTITEPTPSEIELIERTSGKVRLRNDHGAVEPYLVELTLAFSPKRLDELTFEPTKEETHDQRRLRRSMNLNPERSTLRIFDPTTFSEAQDAAVEPVPLVEASLSGTLQLFRHKASCRTSRTISALGVWLLNRGARDGAQSWFKRRLDLSADAPSPKLSNLLDLSSRAGGVRLLEYDLKIGRVAGCKGAFESTGCRFSHQRMRTEKQLTYGVPLTLNGLRTLLTREGPNPWKQMTQMAITQMPKADLPRFRPTLLSLELPYLAKAQVPLLHLVQQQDHPAALIDLASFALYFSRILIQHHVWSFRKPDPSPTRPAQRLPGAVAGLPPPEVIEICSGSIPENAAGFVKSTPVHFRLTRYRGTLCNKPPVMLIHGYSASGTSFAHPSLPCSLAQHLCDEGRDVWILDLRSSAGMPAARYPWSFEQIGYGDIPLAVDHIVSATGFKKIDVVAHCMGSAMLWMAMLGTVDVEHMKDGKLASYDTALAKREALPERIRKLVMSQIGPAMVMAPSNIFRAYLMRYVQQFLPLANYNFETSDSAGLLNTLIDRLLATAPYPPGEFQKENPLIPFGKVTSWVGARHRMDALYGGVFKLANMPEKALEHINDFFGPLNLQTVSQVIHFAANNCITDRTGFNPFVIPFQVNRVMTKGSQQGLRMLSLHGTENKLADVKTLDLMHEVFPGKQFRSLAIKGYGHQDCLLGIRAKQDVFVHISEFLD